MTDTTTPATVVVNALGVSAGGVSVVIFGIQTGLDYPTLLAGVLGGATALSYSERTGMFVRAFEVITASLMAGYCSPILAEIAWHTLVRFDFIGEHSQSKMGLQLGLAAVIGYMAHGVILPGLRKIGAAFIRRTANE